MTTIACDPFSEPADYLPRTTRGRRNEGAISHRIGQQQLWDLRITFVKNLLWSTPLLCTEAVMLDKNDTDNLKSGLGDGDRLIKQETQCSTS